MVLEILNEVAVAFRALSLIDLMVFGLGLSVLGLLVRIIIVLGRPDKNEVERLRSLTGSLEHWLQGRLVSDYKDNPVATNVSCGLRYGDNGHEVQQRLSDSAMRDLFRKRS